MFQGYSRDLHSEVVSAIIETATWQSVRFRSATADSMKEGRGLDRKNPSPTVIGNDFRALGLLIWQRIQAIHANEYAEWRAALDNLVSIRNAVAHSEQTMTSQDTSTLEYGDIVRVGFGFGDFDAKAITVNGDEVTVRIVWNDPTTPEEDIEPKYVTYPVNELLEIKNAG